MSFFYSRIPLHPGYHISFRCHVFLGSSRLQQFLRLFLFLMILSFEEYWLGFCRLSLTWDFLKKFFLLLDWRDWFCEEDRKGKVPFLSHEIKSTFILCMDRTYYWYDCWSWPQSPDWTRVTRFLQCMVTCPLPLSYYTFWKELYRFLTSKVNL